MVSKLYWFGGVAEYGLAFGHVGYYYRAGAYAGLVAHFYAGYQHGAGAYKGVIADRGPYPYLGAGAQLGVVAHGGIGFYDGVMGPGTGSFLIIGLVSVLGYSFLAASAKAKIVNLATNLGAIAVFAAHGSVLWGLGLVLGLSNMAGGYVGARTAVARGSGFIRGVFFAVVAVLIVKLGWDVLRGR